MADQGDRDKPISLFYSYAHEDEALRLKLETHLAVLKRGGLIAEWHDRKLEPGAAWQAEIDRHLTSADIVLLLLSSDFIASDYCWGEEMTKALERHGRGETRVIPVILRHCHWQRTPLGSLQAVPKDGKPIRSWPDEDEAFVDVVAAIERSVQAAREKAAAGRAPERDTTASPPAGDEPSTIPRPTETSALDTLALLDSSVLSRPEVREAGTVFRDIEAPWCPELVVIPAGSFVMGSPHDEKGRDSDEEPQHRVTFASGFALGRYPVTFAEYDRFCMEIGREQPPDQGWGRGRRPVINVAWDDARAYCAWLSQQTGQPYRLPSEAEWEYACRAGTTTPFWTGATIGAAEANYDGGYAYGSGDVGEYRERTTPVDAFAMNPWGVYDLHGNVWEWCEDCWNERYDGAPTDGSPWLDGDCSLRAVRGGSWYGEPRYMRSACRSKNERADRGSNLGFRIARTLTP
jgi:formylglycine-generating enzyme required for sulfatase activity